MNIPIPGMIPAPAAIPLPQQGANPLANPAAMAQAAPQGAQTFPYQAAPPPGPAMPLGQAPPQPMMNMASPSLAGAYGKNDFGVHEDVDPHKVVDFLLPNFRNVESSNNYKATNKFSTASGAYQYTNPTWGNHGGYARAMDAPPAVQDARMREDLLNNLHKYQGDPFKTVAAHYYPLKANDPSTWDQPLVNRYGKEIPGSETLSSYVGKVLGPQRVAAYLKKFGKSAMG